MHKTGTISFAGKRSAKHLMSAKFRFQTFFVIARALFLQYEILWVMLRGLAWRSDKLISRNMCKFPACWLMNGSRGGSEALRYYSTWQLGVWQETVWMGSRLYHETHMMRIMHWKTVSFCTFFLWRSQVFLFQFALFDSKCCTLNLLTIHVLEV